MPAVPDQAAAPPLEPRPSEMPRYGEPALAGPFGFEHGSYPQVQAPAQGPDLPAAGAPFAAPAFEPVAALAVDSRVADPVPRDETRAARGGNEEQAASPEIGPNLQNRFSPPSQFGGNGKIEGKKKAAEENVSSPIVH